MPTRERDRGRLVGAAVALALAATFGLALWRAAAPPSTAVAVPWDRVACARCRMLVSDPHYAGQLHTRSGEVLFFDDPGCLLLEDAEREDSAAALYFHDSRAERWLEPAQVAFVRVPESPMGYGFAAVARDAASDGLSPDDARALLRAGAAAPEGAAQ